MKNSWEKQAAREKQAFVDMAGKIEGLVLKLTRKAGDKGRLFGSVTSTELAEEINKLAGCQH